MVREGATQAEKDALRAGARPRQAVLMQFMDFLGQVLTGDLGTSFRYQQPVVSLLMSRLPATLELVIVATFLALAVGIPLGVLCALKPIPSSRGSPRRRRSSAFPCPPSSPACC
jgi:peptide/nickel transport system permease protein